MQFAGAYVAMAVIFLALDLVWLGVIARDLYRSEMGALIAPEFRVVPAAVFYLLYVAGVVFFVVMPAVQAGAPAQALLTGAFFGLVAYGTYDFTNLAVVRDWPARLSLIDLAWGTVATAAASFGAAQLVHSFR